jgi:hypothetical protein
MQYQCYIYSDAVHYATNQVLTNAAATSRMRIEQLRELLYSLAATIPEAWRTHTRPVLTHQESSIERVVGALAIDLHENREPSHYFVLSSIQLLALTIKQLDDRSSVAHFPT